MLPVAALIRHGRYLNSEIFSKQYECKGRWVGMAMSGSFDRNMNSGEESSSAAIGGVGEVEMEGIKGMNE